MKTRSDFVMVPAEAAQILFVRPVSHEAQLYTARNLSQFPQFNLSRAIPISDREVFVDNIHAAGLTVALG